MLILPVSPNSPAPLRHGYLAFQSFPATRYSAPSSYTIYGRTRTEAIAHLIRAITRN